MAKQLTLLAIIKAKADQANELGRRLAALVAPTRARLLPKGGVEAGDKLVIRRYRSGVNIGNSQQRQIVSGDVTEIL